MLSCQIPECHPSQPSTTIIPDHSPKGAARNTERKLPVKTEMLPFLLVNFMLGRQMGHEHHSIIFSIEPRERAAVGL